MDNSKDPTTICNEYDQCNEIQMTAVPHNAEHTLFVIGNGFDLMHGVPSSYWHFQNSIGKKSPLRNALDNYLKVKEWWSDFEEALASLDVGMMRNDTTVDMWLDIFDAYDPNASAADFYMAAEAIMDPANTITQELPRRFRMWVESLSVPNTERPLHGLITDSKVLCFNYTEFIEDLYGVSHNNVCYIHGCRKKQKGHPKDLLVLGHHPVWEYEGEIQQEHPSLHNGHKAALMNAAYEATVAFLSYYDDATTKDCTSIIQTHHAFFDSLEEIQNIVVVGHSMSPVDWDYFLEIHHHCPNARWYVGYHGANDLQNCKKLMGMLHIGKTNLSVFRI